MSGPSCPQGAGGSSTRTAHRPPPDAHPPSPPGLKWPPRPSLQKCAPSAAPTELSALVPAHPFPEAHEVPRCSSAAPRSLCHEACPATRCQAAGQRAREWAEGGGEGSWRFAKGFCGENHLWAPSPIPGGGCGPQAEGLRPSITHGPCGAHRVTEGGGRHHRAILSPVNSSHSASRPPTPQSPQESGSWGVRCCRLPANTLGTRMTRGATNPLPRARFCAEWESDFNPWQGPPIGRHRQLRGSKRGPSPSHIRGLQLPPGCRCSDATDLSFLQEKEKWPPYFLVLLFN